MATLALADDIERENVRLKVYHERAGRHSQQVYSMVRTFSNITRRLSDQSTDQRRVRNLYERRINLIQFAQVVASDESTLLKARTAFGATEIPLDGDPIGIRSLLAGLVDSGIIEVSSYVLLK